jgi:hypothetical protein
MANNKNEHDGNDDGDVPLPDFTYGTPIIQSSVCAHLYASVM